jgi:hypothetical protein
VRALPRNAAEDYRSPLTDCHKCGKPALKKLVSAAGFRLKGRGWYETDFKTAGKKNVVESDRKESPAVAPKAPDKSPGKASGTEAAGT